MSNMSENRSSEQAIIDQNENVRAGKKLPKRSKVYAHFTEENTQNGPKSQCHYCGEQLSGNTSSIGTNHLRNHLRLKHKEIYSQLLSSQVKSTNNSFDQETSLKLINNSFNQETSRKLLQELVTNGDLPFQILENPYFQRWIASLQPLCTHLNIAEAQRNTLCYFRSERIKLQLELQKLVTVNLSCHTWMSKQFKYFSLTAHFINDDFKVIKRMIGLKELPLEYRRIHLKSALNKWFNDLDIDNKWFTCTLVDELGMKFDSAFHPSGSQKIEFITCCSKLLETLAASCMNAIAIEINSIRFNLSDPAWDERISLQKQIPIAHGGARWDSTYHMLREAHDKRTVFDRYADQHLAEGNPYVLSDDDWRVVGSVLNYMKTFYDAMEAFSKPNTTANLYLVKLLEIQDAVYNESLASDEQLKSLSVDMKGVFKEHINRDLDIRINWAASVLDPRRNKVFLEMCCLELFGEEKSTLLFKGIIQKLEILYGTYVKETKNYTTANLEEAGNSSNTPHQPSFERRYSEYKKQKLNQNTTSELDRYLNEPPLDANENFDVLNWWKSNENRYPVLSRMARDVLSIPILARPSQSAFYIDREIIDYVDDSNLDPKMMEASMCCRQWSQTAHNDGMGKKQIAERSKVYDHFTEVNAQTDLKSQQCHHCGEHLSYNTSSIGTSYLRNHLRLKHKEIYSQLPSSRAKSTNNSFDQETSLKLTNTFNQEPSLKLLQELVTNGDLPFQILENPLFQKWIASLQPLCTHLNLAEAQHNTFCYFLGERNKLQLELKKLVTINLSCHTWISNQLTTYLSITAHFINDDFKLIKRMIGLKQLPLEYEETDLECAFYKFFSDLDIHNRWLNFTLDDELDFKLELYLSGFDQIEYITCRSVFLEDLAEACMRTINDEIGSIMRVIKLSDPDWDEWISLRKQIPIDDDVARWDSTYRMLHEAHDKKTVLDQYTHQLAKGDPSLYVLSDDDWRRVCSVLNYMKTFYDAMEAFSKPNTTANLYLVKLLEIRDAVYNESLASDEQLKSLSVGMKGLFKEHINREKDLGIGINWAASVLDPRRNKVFLEMCCSELFEEEESTLLFKGIIQKLEMLYKTYVKETKNYVTGNLEEAGNSSNTPHQPSVERRYSEYKKKKLNQNTTSELDRYLNEPPLDGNENFDVVNWWKSNENRYPVLSRMARDLLSIPILARPSQSAFYVIDYVDDSNLEPEMLEAIMCCREWSQTAHNDDTSSGALSTINP